MATVKTFNPVNRDKQRPAKGMIPDGFDPAWEDVSKRAFNHKVFTRPGTSENTLVIGDNCHYLTDAGELEEIELVYERSATDINKEGRCRTANYRLNAAKNNVGYRLETRDGDKIEVELVGINDQTPTYNNMTVEVIDNDWYWRNAVNNKLDFYLHLGVSGVSIHKVIINQTSPTKFRWRIKRWTDTPIVGQVLTESKGWDADGHRMEITNTIEAGEVTATTQETFNTEEWTGRVSLIKARRTRQLVWSDNEAVYPCKIGPKHD